VGVSKGGHHELLDGQRGGKEEEKEEDKQELQDDFNYRSSSNWSGKLAICPYFTSIHGSILTKELSLCHKLWFSNPINNASLNYERVTPSDRKDGI